MNLIPVLANVAIYQIVWIACVAGAARGQAIVGIGAAAAAVALHLALAHEPLRELRLIGLAALLGGAFESLLLASGWVRMDAGLLVGGVVPLWMVALWAAFATTLNVSLRALRSRYLLVALLAAATAPLAYYGGMRLGALEWTQALPAAAMIAAGWAVLLPLLMRSAQRYDGFAT